MRSTLNLKAVALGAIAGIQDDSLYRDAQEAASRVDWQGADPALVELVRLLADGESATVLRLRGELDEVKELLAAGQRPVVSAERIALSLRKKKLTLTEIGRELKARNVSPPRGGKWTATQVSRLLSRANADYDASAFDRRRSAR